MKRHDTELPEVCLIEPTVHGDARGHFMEVFKRSAFRELTGVTDDFIQDNQSRSSQGVLRGLHYQIGAHPQGKLVRVLSGAIFDVAVDIRRGSPNFGRWTGRHLSADNRLQLWVPAGFAHAFVVLSASADVLYKVTDRYDPDGERGIRWDDPDIGIDWPLDEAPALSAKDAAAPMLRDAEVFD